MSLDLQLNLARHRWLVKGQVQGVGFRPFVYRIARGLRLAGFVRNDGGGVVIECQGEMHDLREFERALLERHPMSAVLRDVERQVLRLERGEDGFQIEPSAINPQAGADVMVDTATCPDCVRDILSANDRRRGYPLTNCTQCGPRFTIVRHVPYDRCNTTMAGFEMCDTCAAEYGDPADRRFHAQPIACPECGPCVQLVDVAGVVIPGDPIDISRRMLLDGRIIAIKGLGGFHLTVRADDDTAVRRLRERKHRDHKPFALMAGSIEQMRDCVKLSRHAEAIAQSPAAPIVLAERAGNAPVAASVAPGSHRLGVMLPYTPLHHLLFHGSPALPPLVMTSGNLTDEPLATDNRDALARLGPMCDAILWHDRPIERGVDDSVVIDLDQANPIVVRRSRGYAPAAISLPIGCDSPGLCLGGELKNTIAVVRDHSAILSHHLGDLTNAAAFAAFRKTIDDLRELFAVDLRWIAHDLHPTYLSTSHAKELGRKLAVPLIAVQHHHAHAASVMAEHGIDQTILAVICDGTGYGPDGTIWGGELLAANLIGFARLARIRPMRLPGGDAAARDTTRCALALLHQAFGDGFIQEKIVHRLIPEAGAREILGRMVQRNIACASSSGAGRLFDGVAALLGLCSHNHFEAQAAMSLESAAHRGGNVRFGDDASNFFVIRDNDLREIDFSPLVRELVARLERGQCPNELAALFQEQFARAWARTVVDASRRIGLKTVALSGGVFCNAIVTTRLTELLEGHGLRVLRNMKVPPNDGGIALGEAAIAAARIARASEKDGVPCV